jgi:putative membrane protein
MASELEDPRTYFAAERTFLAWIRTGLGLMGVGFALARFGLFLREFQGNQPSVPRHTGVSVYSGVGLVALGVLVNISAITQHIRTTKQLRTGTWTAGQISTQAVALAGILAAIGVGMAVYLLFLR